jgi:8-oxo-dGTP diphosphatase
VKWTVSVKGVLLDGDHVLLGLNDRGEWELPGGQLEAGEQLHDALIREFAEETGMRVHVGSLAHSWVFEVVPGRSVVVIAFACRAAAGRQSLKLSEEHRVLAFHPVGKLKRLPLPYGYQAAIERVCRAAA